MGDGVDGRQGASARGACGERDSVCPHGHDVVLAQHVRGPGFEGAIALGRLPSLGEEEDGKLTVVERGPQHASELRAVVFADGDVDEHHVGARPVEGDERVVRRARRDGDAFSSQVGQATREDLVLGHRDGDRRTRPRGVSAAQPRDGVGERVGVHRVREKERRAGAGGGHSGGRRLLEADHRHRQ